MTYFILIVTFMMSNGQKGVSVTRFDDSNGCFQAMQYVNQEAPNVTALCREIRRGNGGEFNE